MSISACARQGNVSSTPIAASASNRSRKRFMVDPSFSVPAAETSLLRFRDDEPHDEPAVTLDAFQGQTNATAVRLEAGDDALALIPHLGQIALIEGSFPSFRHGRGYFSARILLEPGYQC